MSELLSKTWSILAPVHSQVFSLIFTFIAAFIFWVFRPSVKLIWGRTTNNLNFVTAESGKIEIFSEKHFLQNTGKKAATNVEFVFSWSPDNVSVWQPRDHKQIKLTSDELSVQIPYIAPKELVVIDSVYINRKAAFVASVKCAEVVGKQVDFITNRKFGRAFNIIIAALLFLGVAFVFQTLIGLILSTNQ